MHIQTRENVGHFTENANSPLFLNPHAEQQIQKYLKIVFYRICMSADWREQFSEKHILNSKIKDTDLFLHGTNSKEYLPIQRTGFLLRNIPGRNWSISRKAHSQFWQEQATFIELCWISPNFPNAR